MAGTKEARVMINNVATPVGSIQIGILCFRINGSPPNHLLEIRDGILEENRKNQYRNERIPTIVGIRMGFESA
jgi:hypothetical protein